MIFSKPIKVSHAKRKGNDSENDPTENVTAPRPNDLMHLFKRYKMLWQGLLGLKNDSATVQFHYLNGSLKIGRRSLLGLPKAHSTAGIFRWCLPLLQITKRLSLDKPEVSLKIKKLY